MTDIQNIPLSALQLSPHNARRTGGEDIDDLAASIAAEGVLQNLVVTEGDAGMFDVHAGGRRLRALQQLQQENRLPEWLRDRGIPCAIVASDVAGEASLAENTKRVAMHPADEFVAYQALFKDNRSIEQIAERFGETALHVKQRLKLANIAPDLFENYRNGVDEDLTLDCLKALALTDNHQLQRDAWATLRSWEKDPTHIRNFLTRGKVRTDTGLGMLVDVTEYVAAGGNIERDLFSDVAYFTDRALLDSLALDRLEAEAQKLRGAGWSWAEARLEIDQAELQAYPVLRDGYDFDAVDQYASPEDERRSAEVETRIEEIHEIDEDELDDAERDQLENELATLEGEANDIAMRMVEVFPEAVMARAGVIITLDGNGLRLHRPLLRPGERAGKAKPSAAPGAAPTPQPAKPAELSEAVRRTLSAHRSEAARAQIATDPTLALCVLLKQLLSDFHGDYAEVGCGIRSRDREDATKQADIAPVLSERLKRVPDAVKKYRKATLADLVALTNDVRMDLLAFLVANSFGGMSGNDKGHGGVAAIHQLTAFDMADFWTPTTDDFLGRIPAQMVADAVIETKGKEAAATLNGLKKAERTATAAKLLAGTGWLPKPLRGPTYDKKTKPAATPSDAAPKSKAKPAKKAASKKTVKKKPAAKKPNKAKAGAK